MNALAKAGGDDPDVEVRWEDQQNINEFGRLNDRLHEVRDEQKVLQDRLEKADDASTELMVGEGNNIRLELGDCFMEVTEEYATEFCEKLQEELQERLNKLKEEESSILKRQKDLKTMLYGRFGTSINLEEK